PVSPSQALDYCYSASTTDGYEAPLGASFYLMGLSVTFVGEDTSIILYQNNESTIILNLTGAADTTVFISSTCPIYKCLTGEFIKRTNNTVKVTLWGYVTA
ncbi:unnamed protein product, partial [marine sediment metagenome]